MGYGVPNSIVPAENPARFNLTDRYLMKLKRKPNMGP